MSHEETTTPQEVANTPVQTLEKIATLVDMDPQPQAELLSQVLSHLVNGYATQDYVRHIMVHPNDVEFVTQWLSTIDMPAIVRQLASVTPNDGSQVKPGVIVQSQIETEWLTQHFQDMGLMDFIRSNGAPIMLTHRDLKLLFLLRGVQEAEVKRRKILLPT